MTIDKMSVHKPYTVCGVPPLPSAPQSTSASWFLPRDIPQRASAPARGTAGPRDNVSFAGHRASAPAGPPAGPRDTAPARQRARPRDRGTVCQQGSQGAEHFLARQRASGPARGTAGPRASAPARQRAGPRGPRDRGAARQRASAPARGTAGPRDIPQRATERGGGHRTQFYM